MSPRTGSIVRPRPAVAGVVWALAAAAAFAQEPPPEPAPGAEAGDPAPVPAPAPAPDTSSAPTLVDGTRYTSPSWGLDLPLPKAAELDAAVPMWAVLTWKLPFGTDGHGYLSAGFSEPGESPRAFRRFLLGRLEGDGFIEAAAATPADLPAGASAAVVYRRARDGETRRVVFWFQPAWCAVLVFAHPTATDAAWEAFARSVLSTARVTAPARGLSARLTGTDLGPPSLDAETGVTLRLPKAATPTPLAGRLLMRGWDLPLAYGWNSQLWAIRGADGATTASTLAAFSRGGTAGGPIEVVDERPDAILRTTGFICMSADEGRKVYQLYFFEQGGRVWWLGLLCDPQAAPALKPMMTGMLLSFRATGPGDPRLLPPEGPVHETPGVLLQTEPKQVPLRVLKEFGATVQAAADTARELFAGPAPTAQIRAHCYTPEEMVRRAGKDAAASQPLAQYLPEGRFILVQVPAGKTPERLTLELQRAAFAAYRDGWLQTAAGLPPWLVAGCEELLRLPRKPGAALELDLKRSPLADWIRKNRKSTTWPAIEKFLRGRRHLTADADRAYALAVLIAALRAEDLRLRNFPSRYATRFLARGDPDEVLEDVLDGLDLAAWDAAARVLLTELK